MNIPQRWLTLTAMGLVTSAATLTYAKKEDDVKIKLADCPAAVQKTFEREAKGSAIEQVEKEVKKGKTIYEADIKINGSGYEVKVAEDGTLLSKRPEEKKKKTDKKKKLETRIKLGDCPDPVQKGFQREAGRADIAHVEKKSKKDRTIYEAEVALDGKHYEIVIASDGSLLSKQLEEDDKDND